MYILTVDNGLEYKITKYSELCDLIQIFNPKDMSLTSPSECDYMPGDILNYLSIYLDFNTLFKMSLLNTKRFPKQLCGKLLLEVIKRFAVSDKIYELPKVRIDDYKIVLTGTIATQDMQIYKSWRSLPEYFDLKIPHSNRWTNFLSLKKYPELKSFVKDNAYYLYSNKLLIGEALRYYFFYLHTAEEILDMFEKITPTYNNILTASQFKKKLRKHLMTTDIKYTFKGFHLLIYLLQSTFLNVKYKDILYEHIIDSANLAIQTERIDDYINHKSKEDKYKILIQSITNSDHVIKVCLWARDKNLNYEHHVMLLESAQKYLTKYMFSRTMKAYRLVEKYPEEGPIILANRPGMRRSEYR